MVARFSDSTADLQIIIRPEFTINVYHTKLMLIAYYNH